MEALLQRGLNSLRMRVVSARFFGPKTGVYVGASECQLKRPYRWECSLVLHSVIMYKLKDDAGQIICERYLRGSKVSWADLGVAMREGAGVTGLADGQIDLAAQPRGCKGHRNLIQTNLKLLEPWLVDLFCRVSR